MSKYFFVFVVVCAHLCAAEVIDNVKCRKGPDARNIKSRVTQVRVTPCPQGATGEPCRIPKGINATIEVDFEPTVGLRRPKSGMFWMSRIDMPFSGLKSNACNNYVTCPINANTPTTFSAVITIGSDLPTGQYPIKLKLFDRGTIIFCQTLDILLVNS